MWSSNKWHLPAILSLLLALCCALPTQAAEQPPMPSVASAKAPDLYALTEKVADELGLDRQLLKALVMTESAYDPNTVSKTGAVGLMQLMPLTAKDMGVTDSFDPEQNLRGGATYLKMLINRFDSLVLALAAYNAGPGNVERYGTIPPFAQTRRYVQKVLTHYGKFRKNELELARKNGNQALGSWDLALADLAVLSREIERMDKLSRAQAKTAHTQTAPSTDWQRPIANPEPPSYPAASQPLALADGLVTFQKMDGPGQRHIKIDLHPTPNEDREDSRAEQIAQARARIEARRAQAETARQEALLKRKQQIEALEARRAQTEALRQANRERAKRLAMEAKKRALEAAQQQLARADDEPARDGIKLSAPAVRHATPLTLGTTDSGEQTLRSYRKPDGTLVFTTQPPTAEEQQQSRAQPVKQPSVKPAPTNGRTLEEYSRRQRNPSMPSKRDGIRIRGAS
ncbi:transglycosylase SLT domain-containing protein [Magnetococcus marinus]|uniref:transglycosylase SLT domain-containing protein n=1 Tax=Magnetococcus marinus TaxID=1124597 RepID=UPI001D0FF7D0|nr:transglycosylase SLT domain-containing protein [Magnetococcus marinus]